MLTFSRGLDKLQVREVFTLTEVFIEKCVQVPHILSLSCCVQHSLTFDCCCAQDFRNQQLPPRSPSLCLCIACVALCMFSACHATVAIPLSEPASKLTSQHLQATTQTLCSSFPACVSRPLSIHLLTSGRVDRLVVTVIVHAHPLTWPFLCMFVACNVLV